MEEGGSLLTHEDPWNYKIGSSFMLAHDYGFKRVMSSYYYNGDTDAGAPNDHPHTDCGGGFACEHRWASIGRDEKDFIWINEKMHPS